MQPETGPLEVQNLIAKAYQVPSVLQILTRHGIDLVAGAGARPATRKSAPFIRTPQLKPEAMEKPGKAMTGRELCAE